MQNISFKLGYKYLRSNKGGLFSFTSLLAVIGMMIGLASLIVVTSVMNGFEKELENRILGVSILFIELMLTYVSEKLNQTN